MEQYCVSQGEGDFFQKLESQFWLAENKTGQAAGNAFFDNSTRIRLSARNYIPSRTRSQLQHIEEVKRSMGSTTTAMGAIGLWRSD
jgi:hypothetical protein